MSDYSFKKFIKTGSKLGNYSISLNGKSYNFGFNSGFYVRNKINQYKKVVLFYDNEKKAIAFKFTNDDNAEGVFSLVHSKNQSTGSVTAKSFIIENDLNKPEYYGKKVPTTIEDEDFGELVVIHLLDDIKKKD